MRYTKFGNTGLIVSRLAFGDWSKSLEKKNKIFYFSKNNSGAL